MHIVENNSFKHLGKNIEEMLPLNLVILKTVTVYCQLYLFGIITEHLYSVKFINT